jgi:hypothetical protein
VPLISQSPGLAVVRSLLGPRTLAGVSLAMTLAGSTLAAPHQMPGNQSPRLETSRIWNSDGGNMLTYRTSAATAKGGVASNRVRVAMADQAEYFALTQDQPPLARDSVDLAKVMRPALGILLLLAVFVGVGWQWWLHFRPRLASSRRRQSQMPRDMIDIELV